MLAEGGKRATIGDLATPTGRDLVVVGASAGGVETLIRLAAALPADLPAAVLAVLHLSPDSPSHLPTILDRAGPLPAAAASDGEPIERGRIYVAPPDRHLLVADGRLRVVRGPRENNHRPAIDPLFRSAALAYGPRVVAVVLSGALDDGAAGAHAVSIRGGTTIVQDPDEALHPGMPTNAILADEPRHVVPLAEIAELIAELARSPLPADGEMTPVSDDLDRETRQAALELDAFRNESRPGSVAPFSCPECGGTLWEVEDEPLRFRCRVGHAYAGDSLLAGQSETVDTALWSALRALEERASLARRIAARFEGTEGRSASGRVARYREQAKEAEDHAAVLRDLLAGRNDAGA